MQDVFRLTMYMMTVPTKEDFTKLVGVKEKLGQQKQFIGWPLRITMVATNFYVLTAIG
jgi:hypothetical protein